MKYLLFFLLPLIACNYTKTHNVKFVVEYINGQTDTLERIVYDNPEESYLRNGCLRYWKPTRGFMQECERESAACYVRSFKIIYK